MTTYQYRARDASGREIRGSCEAASESEAARLLREQGVWVTHLQLQPEARPQVAGRAPLSDLLFGEAPPRDLAALYRQWNATVKAGMTVSRSIELSSLGAGGRLGRALREAGRRAVDGAAFSGAMNARPLPFGRVAVALIRAGEASGRLEGMLDRAAGHYERIWGTRNRIRSALIYPILCLIALVIIPGLPVLVLQGFPAYMRTTLLPTLLSLLELALFIAGMRLFLRLPGPGLAFHSLLLLLPILGPNLRRSASARFARTFADLFDVGISPFEALEVAADTCGNRALARRLLRAGSALREGAPLSSAFAAARCLPPTVIHMLATAEESGSVSEQLHRVAGYLEGDVAASTDRWVAALPTLLWIIIAIPMILSILGGWGQYSLNLNKILDENP